MPQYALALAKEVENVRGSRKADADAHNTMPEDLFACLMNKVNDDPSKRSKFGAAAFKKGE